MAKFTRGFTGRGAATRDPRLPPGQYDTGRQWPVLSAEVTPKIAPGEWSFTVEGHVEQPVTWTWDEMHALPPSTYRGDIHCVTTWSKLGMEFEGVSVDTLLAAARPRPGATHVLAFSSTGYTTNLPLADVTDGKAWIAVHRRRSTALPRPWRSRPPPRPAPVLLEEREVGRRSADPRPRRAGVLGNQRLPRPGRPVARAALSG